MSSTINRFKLIQETIIPKDLILKNKDIKDTKIINQNINNVDQVIKSNTKDMNLQFIIKKIINLLIKTILECSKKELKFKRVPFGNLNYDSFLLTFCCFITMCLLWTKMCTSSWRQFERR